MKLLTKSVKNSHFIIIGLITLVLQNIVIFFQHYFNNVGFRWDFIKSYFVTPAFWTTAVDSGIYPQWIPYQSTKKGRAYTKIKKAQIKRAQLSLMKMKSIADDRIREIKTRRK